MKPPLAAAQRTQHLFRHLHSAMAGSSGPTAAPWRAAFLSHVRDMDEPSFVLSTLHPIGSSSSSSSVPSTPQLTPRARTVIFRGMWATLPVNRKNPAQLNSAAFETDLPTITSDTRMEKIPELLHGGRQSGKGGAAEAVFWAPKVRTQWRLRGHTYVVGPDIDTESAGPVREALRRYMRVTGEDGSWSWGRELTAQFGNLSPIMRGTFRNPPPGTPLSETPGEGTGLGLGQKVEDLEDEIARENFRVIVIVPEEVDQVDLTDPRRGRRWNYKFAGLENGGSWKVTELWP